MSGKLKVVALGMLLVFGSTQSSVQSQGLNEVMRGKLANAQQLLEAVVAVDYAGMERASSALSRISETEIESWQSSAQPEYVNQAAAFLSSVRGLREAIAKRDINAALPEYASLVSSCARCHAYVRPSRQASLER
jgi:hypothetical protein